MTRIETILQAVRKLSAEERAELVQRLSEPEMSPVTDQEDLEMAQRGLHLLTESTRDDDWSALYPESLQRLPRGNTH